MVNEHIKAMNEIFEGRDSQLSVMQYLRKTKSYTYWLVCTMCFDDCIWGTIRKHSKIGACYWKAAAPGVKAQRKGHHAIENSLKALTAGQNKRFRKPFTCHYCHKLCHFKKDCRKYLAHVTVKGNFKKPDALATPGFVFFKFLG